MQDDSKGGELVSAACTVVLRDLRELGEKGEQDSPKLRYGRR